MPPGSPGRLAWAIEAAHVDGDIGNTYFIATRN
jgi:hypothetical protein